MITIDIFPWRIHCDNIATREIYKKIERGEADICDCDYCLNFSKIRDEVYPEKARDIFRQLGIDYKKESEVSRVYKTKSGLHNYLGRFYFIGTVERIKEAKKCESDHGSKLDEMIEIDENFSYSFSASSHPLQEAFKNQAVCQVFFSINVPWGIDAKEPEVDMHIPYSRPIEYIPFYVACHGIVKALARVWSSIKAIFKRKNGTK